MENNINKNNNFNLSTLFNIDIEKYFIEIEKEYTELIDEYFWELI